MNCRPTGSPPESSPHGTLIAGTPARLAGIVKTSDRYIASGSSARSPMPERRGGRRRRHQHVEVRERSLVVADDERPDLLRLPVIGVVVAGRQRVRAEHDPSLDLGPEPLAARGRHHGDRVGVGTLGAEAVAHAVVAGEVRRRLRRRDQVVRAERVVGGRQRDVVDLRAERRQPVDRGADGVLHARLHAVAERSFDHADPEPGDAVLDVVQVVRHRSVKAGGVPRVLAREGSQ